MDNLAFLQSATTGNSSDRWRIQLVNNTKISIYHNLEKKITYLDIHGRALQQKWTFSSLKLFRIFASLLLHVSLARVTSLG